MFALDHTKLDLLGTTFGLPIFAILVMTGVESLVGSVGWRQRLARIGWDFAVLGVGLVAGIFGLPQLVKKGAAEASLLGSVCLLVSIGAGVAIMHARKGQDSKLTGARALFSIGCGLGALALPWYFVLTS